MRLSRPSLPKILTCLLALAFSTTGKAQDLYLGANIGMSIPINTEIQKGIYFQPGTVWPSYMADLESRLILKNNLTFSGGFVRGYCMFLGGIRKENWPSFYGVPGVGIDLYDARLAVGYRFPISKRLFLTPEIAGHCLLDHYYGYSGGNMTLPDGVNIAFNTYFSKPYFVPAMSGALLLDWKFKSGIVLRASGRFEQGFQILAYSDYYITDAASNTIEEYHFGSVVRMVQVNFGFHYPISRIWKGIPEY